MRAVFCSDVILRVSLRTTLYDAVLFDFFDTRSHSKIARLRGPRVE